MSFKEEVLYELKHLKALSSLVEKRGNILGEVIDLRKRIHGYVESIPSSENIYSVGEIRYLISYLYNI